MNPTAIPTSLCLTAACVGVMVFVCACGPASKSDSRPTLSATIPPLASLAGEIAGDHFKIECLLVSGQDPHGYEPTPAQLTRLARTKLVLMIGLGVDNWAADSIEAVRGGETPVIALGPKLIDTSEGDERHGAEDGHDHAVADPHLWLDPRMMMAMAEEIGRALQEIVPAAATEFEARTTAAVKRLSELDAELEQRLSPVHGAPFLGQHGAYTWFARRFGLEQVGLIEDWPGKAATPQSLARLVVKARQTGAKVILSEIHRNRKIAEQIARELDIPIATLDPLGDPSNPERGTYADLMRWNADQLLASLSP